MAVFAFAPRNALSTLVLAGAVSAFAGTGAYSQEPASITVTHAQGETVVPVNPETVLTFDLAALDTLTALGIEVDGVPAANFPDYLAKYAGADYLKIGSLFEPDFEVVNAAAPDLIIVAGRSSSQYAALSAIAPTIDLSVAWDNFLPAIRNNVETLGTIFDKEAEAGALLAELDTAVEGVKATAADAGKALIVMTSGGRVTAYGPGSRFGFVHDDLGVTPVIEDVEAATHGEAVSFEFLLETNPDWLIVIDRDAAVGEAAGAAAAEVLNNELVAKTTAWSTNQVVYADAVAWYIVNGGYTAVRGAITQLGEALATAR